jgi:exo-beta-1,3-glucanase (GH17 family)
MQHLFPYAPAICYSGFRDGQQPGGLVPSYEQVREDLRILQEDWKYLRIYDVDEHAEVVFEVIEKEEMDFEVMLGAYILAEVNNPECPWGAWYTDEQLAQSRVYNDERMRKLVHLANRYADCVFSVSIGNEATVDWTDHLIPTERVVEMADYVKTHTDKPVTFCENYLPWLTKLEPLVEVLDFISIHTYPLWEYKHIDEALAYTQQNFYEVANRYPDKPVVITEAGWATASNGRGMEAYNANQHHQDRYLAELMNWTRNEDILCFVFEAFDENWKGSPDPLEPEKHWGIYDVHRQRKTPEVSYKL